MPDPTLRLLAPVRAAITAAAHAAAPRELVGVLGGPPHEPGCIACFVPLPGCGDRDGFAVDAATFAAAEAQLRARGARFRGFVHSHPFASAALSRRDRAELWRDCVQLVVGGAGSPTAEFAAWWLPSGDHAPRALGLESA